SRSAPSNAESQIRPALLADADLAARVVEPEPDPGSAAGRAHDGDIVDGDRHVLVDDAALHGGARLGLVLLHPIDAVDDDLSLRRHCAHDLALLAPVLAGKDSDPVTLLDLHRH